MTDLAAPFPSLSGERLGGRYLIEGLVGRGAVSEVYRAEDLWEGRPVAVKVLRAGAADAVRFDKEVQLLRGLRHAHLVTLCDSGEHRGLPYLVLDLHDRTVADAIAAGPLPVDAVARVGREVASALAYVHAAGIVHRDVKPSNLLLAADGGARLADLGAARLVDSARVTATGMTIGTPAYLAPEQVSGADVGPAADVYALGLVLIEAASGRRAFEGSHPELLAARVARRPVVPAEVPGSWRALVAAMTDLDPARRPSAAAVVEQLDPHRLAAAGSETEVLAVATAAAGVPQGEQTAVLPARPVESAAAEPGLASVALAEGPVRTWLRTHRERAALWAVVAVVTLGLLVGLASAGGDGIEPTPAGATSGAPTTTTTLASTTTAVPTTVAPVAPVDPPDGDRDDGPANGRGNGKPKKDKDDD